MNFPLYRMLLLGLSSVSIHRMHKHCVVGMAWEDFITQFTRVDFAKGMSAQEGWLARRLTGMFQERTCSALPTQFHKNPKFRLSLPADAQVCICLSQINVRVAGGFEDDYPIAIGFRIVLDLEGTMRGLAITTLIQLCCAGIEYSPEKLQWRRDQMGLVVDVNFINLEVC